MVNNITRSTSLSSMIRTRDSFVMHRLKIPKAVPFSVDIIAAWTLADPAALRRRTSLALDGVVHARAGHDHVEEELDVEWLPHRAGDDVGAHLAHGHPRGEDDGQRALASRTGADPVEDLPAVLDRHHEVGERHRVA